MAGKLFLSIPGTVKVIRDGVSVGSIKFPQLLGTNNEKILITGIQYSQEVNAQFMQTLSDSVYVYSFGDKIGSVTIEGIAFARSCGSSSRSIGPSASNNITTNNATSDVHGVNTLFDFYSNNKLSNINNPSVKVGIGTEVIEGFLIGMNISQNDPMFDMYRFSLHIAILPKPQPKKLSKRQTERII